MRSIPRSLKVAGSMMAAAGLAAALTFTPAGAQVLPPPVAVYSPPTSLSVEIGPYGFVADRGLTVYLPITVNCQTPLPGTGNYMSVTIRERVGNSIASSNAYSALPCTGQPISVNVRADAYQTPFRRGSAIVDVQASVCGSYYACVNATDRANVYLF